VSIHIPLSGRLPAEQFPIKTKNKEEFETAVLSIAESRTTYPIIAVVDGLAGTGKSVAAYDHIISLRERSHNGLRAGLLIEIPPGVTPREVARTIVFAMGEKPQGRDPNRFSLKDNAVRAILDNDIEYIIWDEADRFNEDSFEMVRVIFDESQCPFILVGLPSIRQVIRRHEKFDSRVGFYLRFTPLDREETLHKILPELTFPCWEYDPDNPEDYALGEYLLSRVGESFRRLRNVLRLASIAVNDPKEPAKITREDIDDACNYAQRQSEADLQSATPGLGDSGDRGEAEIKSEQRNAYKRGKRQGNGERHDE